MVGLGVGAVGVSCAVMAATSGVGDISVVKVGIAVKVVATSTTNGPAGVGVSEGTTTGRLVEVRTGPPEGVGDVYCPHRDALPTQDAVNKEIAINNTGIRLTLRPFKELYL